MALNGFGDDLSQVEGLSDEQKEKIQALADNRADGLVNKNAELMDKLKALKNNGDASAAELEKLRQLEANLEQKKAEDAQNYEQALNLAKSNAEKQIGDLQSKYDKLNGQYRSLIVDQGLSDALDSVEVDPALKAGAVALLKDQVEVTDGKALIGDKSLSDYVKGWAESDQGKAFTLAAHNSGAGVVKPTPGSTGGQSKKLFTQMSLKERTEHIRAKQSRV